VAKPLRWPSNCCDVAPRFDVSGVILGTLLPAAPQLLLFVAAVFVLNATPGVDFVLTVTRTLARGPRAGVAAALGISSGCIVHALAAAFGLAAALAVRPQAFVLIQWAGAAYLVWIAVGLLRQAWRPAAPLAVSGAGTSAQSSAKSNAWAEYRSGLLTNVLNPKVALFFLAFLPQFVPAGAPHKTASFLLLGAWFVVQGTLFLFGLVALAARLRRWQMPTHLRRVGGSLAGVLFIALALRLLGARPA
jgi:threonine/homoserine/homoserine lactone efflux protein